MRRRRRILILTPSLPYPPIWGFGTRVFQFIRLLARNHDVSLVTYVEPGEDDKLAALQRLCPVRAVPRKARNDRDKRLTQFSSIFSRRSYQRTSLWSAEMQDALNDLMSRERYDVIQVESSQLAGFTFDRRAVLVLDEHNIEYELLRRMWRGERSPVRRFYNWLEYLKFKREEIESWRESSGCVMTSALEQHVVQQIAPDTPATVVANGVDADYFRSSGESIDAHAIVMTGLMHYRPNVDAALYFVRHILPRILAGHPGAVFYIVGGGPPAELKRLAGPNVVVTGFVDDVRPFVNSAAVFVVPLRVGGGTRLKVLEGLSMEKAMVSTSLGCEGIDVRDREHLLIADEPHAFADAVLELVKNRELAARLGRQGRALVARQYTWDTVVNHLEVFHGQLLDEETRRAS
jgi:glycosyltransferase involved in cell wall biosynthesis